MKRHIFAVAAVAWLAYWPGALADDRLRAQDTEAPPSSSGAGTTFTGPTCFQFYDVLRLCGGNPPTIWMAPDVAPAEVARQFLDAMRQLGLKVERNAP